MSRTKTKPGFWQRLMTSLTPPDSMLPPYPSLQTAKMPTIGELTQIVLNGAHGLALERQHARAGDWHLLAALLATDPVQRALAALDAQKLCEQLAFVHVDAMPPSLPEGEAPELDPRSFHRATIQALSQQVPTITVLHLLAAVVMGHEVGDALVAHGVDTTVLALWPRYKDRWPRTEPGIADDEEVELIMHNDDSSTMEFVESQLAEVMGFTAEQSRKLMLQVHKENAASLGRMSADEARLRAEAIMEAARLEGFPLVVTYRRAATAR